MRLLLRIAVLVVASASTVLGSRARELYCHHFGMEDGLSHYSVIAMYQDERGLIWAGTSHGISLYTGNGFVTYRTDPDDPGSIFCDNILRITGDGHGKVWFQTQDGISEFDIARERFTTIFAGTGTHIHYGEGLYMAQGNRIMRRRGGETEPYHTLSGRDNAISAIYSDPERGAVIVGTRNGVYLLRETDGTVTESNPLTCGPVTNIFRDSRGRYWIGTMTEGLYIADEEFATVRNMRNDPGNGNSVSSDFVRIFCEDLRGDIYVGTFNGLNKFISEDKGFERYVRLGRENGIESSSVWSLVCDHQNNIWIGTFFEGIYLLNPTGEIYRKYEASVIESDGLSSPIVSGMTEDENGNMYIATEVGGFNRYNRLTGEYKWFRHLGKGRNSTYYNNVKGLYYDTGRKALWLGTHMGGLFRFDTDTERLSQYTAHDGRLPSDIVRQITERDGKLILATHGGICMFDPESCSYSMLPGDEVSPGNITGDLRLSRDGRKLWFTDKRPLLHCYDFDDRRVESYSYADDKDTSFSSSAACIAEDSEGRIWIGTENDGVYVFLPQEKRFERLNIFTSNSICSIAESAPGEFIIVADNGFSFYDHDTGDLYKRFVRSEIPLEMINQDALFIASDSTIFIGGTDGMVSFDRKKFFYRSYPLDIFPLSLTVNGRTVNPGDSDGILHGTISTAKRLRLSSRHSILSLRYAVTDYSSTSLNVEYRLQGLSDEWNPMPADYIITLIKLPAAKYTLQVRASDNYGTTKAMHTLSIVVPPLWYNRWWAYVLFTAALVTVLYLISRAYTKSIKLQESLKYERQHNQDLEELSQSKLRFFTNVAHEFRTPLTIITGHIEAMLQSRISEPWVYRKLLSIHKNGIALNDLIGELLDFRSQEQGHMKLHATQNDLVGFLRESYLLFREYATLRGCELLFETDREEIEMWFDVKQMQKVINNLLSNALKYTAKDKGHIVLRVGIADGCARFSVEDNGSGIPKDEIESIFKRFYRADNVNVGTGIGLALTKGIVELHSGTITVTSNEGRGSTFTITLPLGKAHLTDEQISHDQPMTAATFLPDIVPDNTEERSVPVATEGGKRFDMLVVEDNENLCEMFREIFAHYYNVETAGNGREALEKMKSFSPDIIVSDISMPEMSGIELCKAVKSNFDTSHIPVVLLTAHTSTDTNIRGLQVGADDYITKPFSTNIVISRCNNLINNRLILKEKFGRQSSVEPQSLAYNPIDRAFMDKAMEIIERNIYDAEFSINRFAQEMCVARTKLFVKLKAITGQTPYEFIMTIKLRRAADMLRNNPEYNISEISDMLGFNTQRYFSKCFKEKYGISPLQYRNNRSSETKR